MKKAVKSTKNKDEKMHRYLGALNEIHGENLKGIREGFEVLNRKLDSHTEMIGTLMEDVSVLKTDMVIVKDDLSVIKIDLKRKVDYDDFLSLVKRVQKIEAKI